MANATALLNLDRMGSLRKFSQPGPSMRLAGLVRGRTLAGDEEALQCPRARVPAASAIQLGRELTANANGSQLSPRPPSRRRPLPSCIYMYRTLYVWRALSCARSTQAPCDRLDDDTRLPQSERERGGEIRDTEHRADQQRLHERMQID